MREAIRSVLDDDRNNKTRATLAKHMGWPASFVTKILQRKGKPRRIQTFEWEKIKDYLDLDNNFSPLSQNVNKFAKVLYGGIISSSVWTEKGDMEINRKIEIAPYGAQRYAQVKQEAWEVNDESCGYYAQPGMFLIAVSYKDVSLQPQENDIVIVEECVEIVGESKALYRYTAKVIVYGLFGLEGHNLRGAPKRENVQFDKSPNIKIHRYVIGKVLYSAR